MHTHTHSLLPPNQSVGRVRWIHRSALETSFDGADELPVSLFRIKLGSAVSNDATGSPEAFQAANTTTSAELSSIAAAEAEAEAQAAAAAAREREYLDRIAELEDKVADLQRLVDDQVCGNSCVYGWTESLIAVETLQFPPPPPKKKLPITLIRRNCLPEIGPMSLWCSATASEPPCFALPR